MFHSTCHAALGHGQPCSQEISCKLAHRGLRCATARDGVRSCRCKEDTRWDRVKIRAAHEPLVFTITEKVPTRAFSWLNTHTSAFTFKTLLIHYDYAKLMDHLQLYL